jgi:dTDP-glucose 4,6-dehydratase
LSGKKAIVHGDGRYVRNWIHVADNVDALYQIIDRGKICESYHVSSEEEISVKDIVTMIASKLNLNYDDVIDTTIDRSGCDERYALNCDKLKLELGWKQKRFLSSELDKIIEFYRSKQ